MITLALVTPLGVVVGMVVTEYTAGQSGTQIMVMGLLQGLAGGTLLYITFYEVLEREKLEKMGMDGLAGCFLLILGFSIMAGLEAAGNCRKKSQGLAFKYQCLTFPFLIRSSFTWSH